MYRIERDGNATYNGVEGTIYHVYRLDRAGKAFVHEGKSIAPGFDRSDSECLDHWITSENWNGKEV